MSIQIPNLHTSNKSKVTAERAIVFIKRRQGGGLSGRFSVSGSLQFNPLTDAYPSGAFTIKLELTDSIKGTVVATTVEQLDTTGKVTPTAYATGRCNVKADPTPKGCRYWIMFVDNKRQGEDQTADVISFLIYDRNGKRVAYGTGPVIEGDVFVTPTSE